MELQIILAFVLFLFYLLSKTFARRAEKYHQNLLSFSSGILISIIFIEILPELAQGAEIIGSGIYILMLLSFLVYHLVEKYIYLHAKSKREIKRELKEFHIFGFFLDNFIIGFFLAVVVFTTSFSLSILLFFTLLISVIASSFILNHIEERFKVSNPVYLLLASSILLGSILATLLHLDHATLFMALAVTTGFLLYFVVRDSMPRGGEGKPVAFAVGVFVVIAFFLLSGLVV